MTVSVRINQTVFISKFALSRGIETAKVRHRFDNADGKTSVKVTGLQGYYLLGRDVHLTLAEATVRAEVMRAAKLKSLGKQTEKFSNMKF